MASKTDPALKNKTKPNQNLAEFHPSFLPRNPCVYFFFFFFFFGPGQGVFAKGCCICPQNSTIPRAKGTIPPPQRSQTGESMLASSGQGSGTDPQNASRVNGLLEHWLRPLPSSRQPLSFPPCSLPSTFLRAERPAWCILSKPLILTPAAR